MPSDEDTFYQPQTSQAPYREPKNNFSNHSSNTKRVTNSTQSCTDAMW